jgi:prepilin-type N-terminal cleavage/methylation domain-containing protein
MSDRTQHARGFTLIEVIIAAGLLVALSAGATMVLTLTMNTIARSRQRTVALLLAHAKLEAILSLPGSAGASARSPPDALFVSRPGFVDSIDAQGAPGAIYMRRWAIGRTGTDAADLAIVQVMVTPTAPGGDRDAVWISGARLRRSE